MKYERRTKKVNAKKSVYKLTFPNELTEVSYNLDFKNDYAMLGMGINTAYLKFDDDIKIKNLKMKYFFISSSILLCKL